MITRELVDPRDNATKIPKKSSSSSSWTRFKDPRIVHVPRAFGGKDRHSKVFTVKGLRDRRVRLSVPTALQLYDLQNKLGLDQPSKVVDWLLNEAKHEIDELPPLQMPPMTEFLKLKRPPPPAFTGLRKGEDPQLFLEGVRKATHETMVVVSDDEDAVKLAARNLDLINLLKGNSNCNSFNLRPYQNDFFPRSVPLAHSGSHHGEEVSSTEEIQNFNVMVALPSTMYSMPLSSQGLVCPPGLPQYFFHPQKFASAPEIFDPKDINFQTLMSSCSENPSSSRYQLFLPSSNKEEKKSNKGMDQFYSNYSPR